MATKKVIVNGFLNRDNQFEVIAQNFSLRVGINENNPVLHGPSPLEYLLAGYAGCVAAVGRLVAKELDLKLDSLEVEISGDLSLDKFQGIESTERAGFKSLEVEVKPQTKSSIENLKKWISLVEKRCPLHDNLLNSTPINLSVFKEIKVLEPIG